MQKQIGDLGLGEGSLGHAGLHALAGCVASEARGDACLAGAVGGLVASLYGGTDPASTGLSEAEIAERGELYGAIVGYLTSGGDASHVSAAATVAASAITHNYLAHDDIVALRRALAQCPVGPNACREAVLARFAAISEENRAALQACTTRACWDYHAGRMQGAQDQVLALYEAAIGLDATVDDVLLEQFVTTEQNNSGRGTLLLEGGIEVFEAWSAQNCTSMDHACLRAMNSTNTMETLKMLVDFIPVVGDVKGAWECLSELSGTACGGALVGVIPVAGDFGKIVLRRGDEVITVTRHSEGAIDVAPSTADEISDIAQNTATIGGKTCVYVCVIDGIMRYVGITDDVLRRGAEHMAQKGIKIQGIRGLENLSRADARAVEQTLISYYGLGKDGGTLLNKINSISSTRNPTAYEQALIRGKELLDSVEYQWTN